MRILIVMLSLVASVVAGAAAQAEEVIEQFQSDIQVLADGSMEVIETITVNAQGQQIRRGIYRDFPTVYRDRLNNRVQVRFEVVAVRRNGTPEPWFTRPLRNGVRVYAGSEDVTLSPGIHTYEFVYRSNRQLGFFDGHDELYWNVTGNDWAFPINEAVAFVYLPKTVPAGSIAVEAYTGRSGHAGRDYEAGVDEEGVAWLRSTRRLEAGEGLTLVTTWPKGHVRPPTQEQKLDWFLEDNAHVLAGIIGVLVLLAYYALAWFTVGRDPAAGVLVPRYEPPHDCSPAVMRYVKRMGYDSKCFTAAVVNLAVKGYLRIDDDDGEFTLSRVGSVGQEPLAAGEKALLDKLPAGTPLVLERSNHARVRKAMAAHQLRIEAEYEKNYFLKNRGFTLFGGLISLLVLATAVIWSGVGEELAGTAFMLAWLSGWSFGVFALVSKAIGLWRGARTLGEQGAALFVSTFTVPFVGAWFMGAVMLSDVASAATVVLLVCLIGINFLFYHLMKAPTLQGRRLLDEVDGFHEYLRVAEVDELRLINPPRETPELFERYLPYAIALDVEDVWGRRFESVLASASRAGHGHTAWYHGSRGLSARSLADGLGSGLSASVSSSSQAPGSSSGSGGGGSSGGGGGGGGGGGW